MLVGGCGEKGTPREGRFDMPLQPRVWAAFLLLLLLLCPPGRVAQLTATVPSVTVAEEAPSATVSPVPFTTESFTTSPVSTTTAAESTTALPTSTADATAPTTTTAFATEVATTPGETEDGGSTSTPTATTETAQPTGTSTPQHTVTYGDDFTSTATAAVEPTSTPAATVTRASTSTPPSTVGAQQPTATNPAVGTPAPASTAKSTPAHTVTARLQPTGSATTTRDGRPTTTAIVGTPDPTSAVDSTSTPPGTLSTEPTDSPVSSTAVGLTTTHTAPGEVEPTGTPAPVVSPSPTVTPPTTTGAEPTLTPTPTVRALTSTVAPTLTPETTQAPTPTPEVTSTTGPPTMQDVKLQTALRLSDLDIAEAEDMRAGIKASIVALLNIGFRSTTDGAEQDDISHDDVSITAIRAGSVIVEFEVALRSAVDGGQLQAQQVRNDAAAALKRALTDDAEVSRVFEENGVEGVGEVSLVGEAAPPLSPSEGEKKDEWWDPSQPLMMAIIAAVSLILLVLCIGLVVCLAQRRSLKVKPSAKVDEKQDIESGEKKELLHSGEHDRDPSNTGTPAHPDYTSPPALKPPVEHVPPKAPKHEGQVHNTFSDRRSPHEEPFQRLILVSSRTPNAEKVVDAALTDCAVGLYDWKRFTPPELLEHVKSMLGGRKVDSVAVIASGSKAGGVGLLEGHQTTARKLSKKKELAQFWKRLASNVVSDSGRKGCIHLLSCRVTEAAQDGAELLAVLQKQTNLEVLASDDHRDGYPISQSCQAEDGSYYLSVSGEHAMDLYFDAARLTQALTVAPALGTPTPAHRAGRLAPLGDAAPKHAQPTHAHAPPPPVPPAVPVSPYGELLALAHTNINETKAMAFKHSSDGNGHLSFPTITSFFQELNPSMKNPELAALLIDLKRSQSFDVDHLLEELQLVDKVYQQNMAGRDDDAVLERLHAYLSSNKDIMQQVFDQVDKDGSGRLDMHELCQLVGMIPGLDVSEVRYILINLMTKRDLDKDNKLSLDELCAIIR